MTISFIFVTTVVIDCIANILIIIIVMVICNFTCTYLLLDLFCLVLCSFVQYSSWCAAIGVNRQVGVVFESPWIWPLWIVQSKAPACLFGPVHYIIYLHGQMLEEVNAETCSCCCTFTCSTDTQTRARTWM